MPESAVTSNDPNDPTGVEPQRAKLDRLGDLALELSEMLVAKAREATADTDLERITLAFSRASRVVRLTCALHAKLAQIRQAIEMEQISLGNKQHYRDATRRTDARIDRKKIITRVVARVALRDDGLDEAETLELLGDCRERMDDDTLIDLMDRPVSELIAEFCRELGLNPDWEALVAEAWAQKEFEGGDVGAPLAAIAERMIAPPRGRRSSPPGPASDPISLRAASP